MSQQTRKNRLASLERLAKAFGPGVITGAADDDPSGIATYSIVGAQLGTSLLWTAWLTWPLMAAVQMMCARIGIVSGKGLSSALSQKIPRPLLVVASFCLLAANTVNIGADLGAMAEAAELLTGWRAWIFLLAFALAITWATIGLHYRQIAEILKWLVIALFAYVADALYVASDWRPILHSTFVPAMPHGKAEWTALVAILGTTISPYLFYWQTAQEVEEQRCGAEAPALIQDRRIDVGAGTFFSNLVMYFIILTTALTLHPKGLTHIETASQVAEALRPLAGKFATALYALGLIGTGLLAIPTLTGSASYAFSETFGWKQGLDLNWKKAKPFYALIVTSTLIAVLLNVVHVNPVRALYWSAILNGLLAPFIMVAILFVACDAKIMQGRPSSRMSRILVSTATLLMFGAAIGMLTL